MRLDEVGWNVFIYSIVMTECCLYQCCQCLCTTTTSSDGGVSTTTTTCSYSLCYDFIKSGHPLNIGINCPPSYFSPLKENNLCTKEPNLKYVSSNNKKMHVNDWV